MDHDFKFKNEERPIVLVRPVLTKDLPGDIQARVGDVDEVYAILSEEGDYVALAADRRMAFDLARINELVPHSVH